MLDQGIPADAVPILRALGYQCQHVSELGMQRAEDHEILAEAQARGTAIVTLDADFHALAAVRRLSKPSIIRLRRDGCRADSVAAAVHRVIERFRGEIDRGCLVSIKERKTTCHLLPIGGRDQ